MGYPRTPCQQLELADTIECCRFPTRVRHGHGDAAGFITDLESVLRLSYLANTNGELSRHAVHGTLHQEAIPQVAVRPLIERTVKTYPRLHRQEPTAPCTFIGHTLPHSLSPSNDSVPIAEFNLVSLHTYLGKPNSAPCSMGVMYVA
jgi:hypothetical protein